MAPQHRFQKGDVKPMRLNSSRLVGWLLALSLAFLSVVATVQAQTTEQQPSAPFKRV
jgi:hypothetical protein